MTTQGVNKKNPSPRSLGGAPHSTGISPSKRGIAPGGDFCSADFSLRSKSSFSAFLFHKNYFLKLRRIPRFARKRFYFFLFLLLPPPPLRGGGDEGAKRTDFFLYEYKVRASAPDRRSRPKKFFALPSRKLAGGGGGRGIVARAARYDRRRLRSRPPVFPLYI